MKIAYTINGLIGGLSGKNQEKKDKECRTKIASYCKNTIADFFCKEDNIDFFIFTWEGDILNDIKEVYKAKVCISEKQPVFPVPHGIIGWLGNVSDAEKLRVQSHYARWYGYKRIIEELTKWSSENNISYDYVINARFDLCWNRPYSIKDKDKILLSRCEGRKEALFNLDTWPNKKTNNIEIDIGKNDLQDHIFGGNPAFMSAMSGLFEKIEHLHVEKGYRNHKEDISNHRLLPGMVKLIGFKQEDINYLHHIPAIGKKKGDYDLFRYRNVKKENLA